MNDNYLEFYFTVRLGGFKYNGKSVEWLMNFVVF
jgi:hypothetical protein